MIKKNEDSNLLFIGFLPPRPRRPRKFWGPRCLYGVGAGKHAKFHQDLGNGPFEWHIGFLHAANQVSCGSGRYRAEVLDILEAVTRSRNDFFVVEEGDDLPNEWVWSYLNIFKRYYLRDHPLISTRIVAEDLVWLMRQSFPAFQAL